MIKKIVKYCLIKISRIIYYLIPGEFTKQDNTEIYNILYKKKINECYEHFEKYFDKAVLFHNTWKIREYAIKNAISNDKEQNKFYLEFGVWKGDSANFFSKNVNKLYAFDSFEGLREDWHGKGITKGHLNLHKKIPKLEKNIEPIIGWVQDTLEEFLKKHKLSEEQLSEITARYLELITEE